MVDFFRDGMRAVERILPELPLHPPVTYKGTIRSAQHYRELVQNWLALKPNATRAAFGSRFAEHDLHRPP